MGALKWLHNFCILSYYFYKDKKWGGAQCSTSVNDEKATAAASTAGSRGARAHARSRGWAYGSTQFYEVNAV